MKTTRIILLAALSLGVSHLAATAQDAQGGGRPPGGPGGGPGGPGGRPGSPIMAALDTNKDGELDSTEIANATAALKALDKNGDGKLSGDEIRPARGDRGPGGPGRQGGGPGGPGGPGGERQNAR